VELSLQELGPDEVVRMVRDKQLDAGFLYLPVDETDLEVRSISREPLIAALPDTHPLVTHTQLAMRQLAEEPFILPPSTTCRPATIILWRRAVELVSSLERCRKTSGSCQL
jgi:DNA-binding transcriptional LysR family regulator